MSLYSLYALIGFLDIVLSNLKANNWDLTLLTCDAVEQKLTKGWDYWMYGFYLSKYVEFLDSFFLVLKGKSLVPPENSQFFLHVFHHTSTASIVWFAWLRPYNGRWTGPITNTFIHFIMYGYYFLAEMNWIDRRLGGKFITPLQIAQFVFCLAFNAYETFNIQRCGSDPFTVFYMWVTYLIFLYFFVQIFTSKKEARGQDTSKAPSTSTGNKIKTKAD